MRLITQNGKRIVNVGGTDIWKSVYSTAVSCAGEKAKSFPLAIEFLKTGSCEAENGYSVARQINLLRDYLSRFSPDSVVYDIENPKAIPPWKGNISPVITSCANFYTTADGEDLLYEIVSILCYAQIAKTSVMIG